MDGHSLYETDFYAWSQNQAAVLRAMAREPANLPNALDIENVAEEIEGVGNSQLSAMASRVRLILAHLIKCVSQPDSRARRHWETEMIVWHGDLLADLTKAMHRKIDMDREWRRAMREARAAFAEHDLELAPGFPAHCPYILEALLNAELDVDTLLNGIRESVQL